MPLFTFRLKPLIEVIPWGDPPMLHWFGLTEGTYGMNIGGVDVFRYDPAGAHARGWSDAADVVDYQVARFWEDVLDVVPAALTAVPKEIAARLETADDEDALLDAIDDAVDRAVDDEQLEAARMLVGERRVTSGHLVEGPSVLFVRSAERVLVRFDGRARRGRRGSASKPPLWSPQIAETTLTVDAFVAELQAFDTAFLTAMGERVDAVRNGALGHIAIDRDHLAHEQSVQRPGTLASRLKARVETDWSTILFALRRAGVR